MVDVREIAERARELKELDELIFRFMPLSSAQAVTVRVIPWLLLDDDYYRVAEKYFEFLIRTSINNQSELLGAWEFGLPFVSGLPSSNPDWDTLTKRTWRGIFGGILTQRSQHPLHVELQVRQDAYGPDEAEVVRRLIDDTPLFVTVARRGPMQLQLASGDRIRSGNKTGTIGGFVADQQGTVFGLTCSHVASSGSVTDTAGNTVGKVRASTTQTPMATGSVCHPNPRRGSVACAINDVDLALVEMSAAVTASGLTLAGSLAQGDAVDVDVSRARYRFNVRSVCMAMQFGLGGADFCYSPMIELYSTAGTTWPGDSGAWGLTNQFSEWATLVVGADSISSFAIDARDVADWIDSCGVIPKGTWSVY